MGMGMKTQLDYAYEWEQRTPHTIWLRQPMGGGRLLELTWSQALDQVRRMAAHLESLGFPRGRQIALFSKNTAWWFLADLAIWMSGHVSVPLYPTLTADTIRQILDHSEAKLVFVGKLDGYDAMAPGIPAELPRIAMPLSPKLDAPSWDDLIARTAPLTGQPKRDPKELATIIYTSGSTGVPKGVMHSFETMCAASNGFVRMLKMQSSDRMLSYLPLAHAFERALVETPTLISGAQIWFAESLETFVEDLKRAQPTLFVSVPRLWHKFQTGVHAKVPPKKLDRLLKIPLLGAMIRKKVLRGLGLDKVRFAGSGSAPIPSELITWYRRLGLDLLEGYGMSENFAYSHLTRPGEVSPGYVGRPQDGVEATLGPDKEVWVKSPGTMLGYFKAPELTAEVFSPDGFLKTGDQGEVDQAGRLKITGRVKELFKTSKGKYVAPAPIENQLLLHPHVEQACVSGNAMPQPFGMVVLSEPARKALHDAEERKALHDSLMAHVSEVNNALDPHERLELVAVIQDEWTIENGMLTPTMKIKRSAIEERYGTRADAWYARKAPIVWAEEA